MASNHKWNCEKKSCFVKSALTRFDAFNRLFPDKIRMSDIDGVVEVSGRFFFFEFKPLHGAGKSLDRGQRVMLENLSRFPWIIVVVAWLENVTDPRTIKAVQIMERGQIFEKEVVSWDKFSLWLERFTAGCREMAVDLPEIRHVRKTVFKMGLYQEKEEHGPDSCISSKSDWWNNYDWRGS